MSRNYNPYHLGNCLTPLNDCLSCNECSTCKIAVEKEIFVFLPEVTGRTIISDGLSLMRGADRSHSLVDYQSVPKSSTQCEETLGESITPPKI